ncbi:hypothetical protein [Paenibacillus aestuarii]|uniref:Uncharacterized protein n=1 Tax=Paenibacillus aestuarii TaxID=516965 RepID=A0ABW0K6W8_9BACL|nr:hypothetical protein [Paenibacillus aestuarii]
MQQTNMSVWFWARIFLAILLVAAIFSRIHGPTKKEEQERLQWQGSASAWLPAEQATTVTSSTTPNKGVMPELIIAHQKRDARLQLSVRLKPIGTKDSAEVHPVGTGTLTNGEAKIHLFINSTSTLTKRKLADGTVYVSGTMSGILNLKGKQTNVDLVIKWVEDTNEIAIAYPYTDQGGVILFGTGMQKHRDEIDSIQ